MNGNRRGFLRTAGVLAAAAGTPSRSSGQFSLPRDGTVRDRLWIFANPVNADFNYVRKRSVMTPLEACVYMGVPNLLMVNQHPGRNNVEQFGEEGRYKAFEPPYEQYAYSLRVLKRVVWSIVGASGATGDDERRQVLELARKTPNITGVFMDDFFTDRKDKLASLTLEQVRDVRRELRSADKKLDLYVTLYTRQIDPAIREYLDLIDVVTLWTWETAELANIEASYGPVQALRGVTLSVPKGKIVTVLGANGAGKSTILKTISGRIEGIILYGTAMDLGWDSVEWARQWIAKVADERL